MSDGESSDELTSGVARALNQFGMRVQALRLKLTLTQEAAAAIAMIEEKHWRDIEDARTDPTVATLVGVARALKVTLSELFGHGGEK